jgi:glycerophosphoryl diester phosphodiesterase
MTVRTIAHRGASAYAPENTMSAFVLAHEMGATAIELDVELTADEQLVVIHDSRIDRTSNGTGRVADMTLAELREYDYSRTVPGSARGDGTRIPTLHEVLEFAAGRGMFVNIETKDHSERALRVNDRVAEAVHTSGRVDNTLISSINHAAMAAMKVAHPEFRTAIAFIERFADLAGYASACGADVVHPYYAHVDEEFVRVARAAGLGINVWTVDDDSTADRMRALDIDGLMTNRPDVGGAK